MPLAEVVNTGDLLEVVWASAVAGVGVTAVYGLAILGGTRAIDLSRHGRIPEAVVFGVLCAIALAGVAAAVVFGIVVMTSK